MEREPHLRRSSFEKPYGSDGKPGMLYSTTKNNGVKRTRIENIIRTKGKVIVMNRDTNFENNFIVMSPPLLVERNQ
jgi:hypothetical protein